MKLELFISHRSRLWRWFAELLLAVASLQVQAAGDVCSLATTPTKSPYSVACGGKSECLPVDQLEIKPLENNANPITTVCLRLADGRSGTPLDTLESPATASLATPLIYPLAPLLHKWQQISATATPMAAAEGGHLYLTAVLTDNAGTKFNVDFGIDLTSLWAAGTLKLQLLAPICIEPCGFDSVVKLVVPNLGNWKLATKGDPAKLTLVLSGIRLTGMPPEVGDGELIFRLRRVAENAENSAAWATIIKRALSGDTTFRVALADDKGLLASADKDNHFDLPAPQRRAGVSLGFVVVLLLVVLIAGFITKWRLLRDSYSIPDRVLAAQERTLSLGRCQMFWWTLVIVTSWGIIWYSTGNWMSFNDSALVLMGISVGTAAGAVAATPPRVTALVKALNDATPGAAFDAAAAAIQAESELKSKGWINDLLADYNEDPGLHRLQNIIFSVGFGIAFVWMAYSEGVMPILPNTVLALIGISGSAYVGFKMAGK